MAQPRDHDDTFSFERHSIDVDTGAWIYMNPHNAHYLKIPDFLFNHLSTPIYVKYDTDEDVRFIGALKSPFIDLDPFDVKVKDLLILPMIAHFKAGKDDLNRRIVALSQLRELMDAGFPLSEASVSCGVDSICLNVQHTRNTNLIPIIVQNMLTQLAISQPGVPDLPATHRVLYCDYTLGQRFRMFALNGNGMAQWMRMLAGELWIYWAPMTPNNLSVFRKYVSGAYDSSDIKVIRHLHFVMRVFLTTGDTVFIPPNSIVFEITKSMSLVARGDFFSGVIIKDEMFTQEPLLRELFYKDDFIYIYHRLALGIIAHFKSIVFNFYMGMFTCRELLDFIYKMVEGVKPSTHGRIFNYGYNSISRNNYNRNIARRDNTMRTIKLFIKNSISTIFRNDASFFWNEIDMRVHPVTAQIQDLIQFMDPKHNLYDHYLCLGDPTFFILFLKQLCIVNVRALINNSIGWMIHNPSEIHCWTQLKSEQSEMIINKCLTQYNNDKESNFNRIRFIGIIQQQELTLGGLFNIAHCDINHPDRKLAAFIQEYKNTGLGNQHIYGLDSFMIYVRELKTDTFLDVDVVLSYLYYVARYNDIERYYHFAKNCIDYYKNDASVSKSASFEVLRMPIMFHRAGTTDEWVTAFLDHKDVPAFNSVFQRASKILVKPFNIHNDKTKRILQREWCGLCTRFTLVRMGIEDQIQIIRFRICEHSIKE